MHAHFKCAYLFFYDKIDLPNTKNLSFDILHDYISEYMLKMYKNAPNVRARTFWMCTYLFLFQIWTPGLQKHIIWYTAWISWMISAYYVQKCIFWACTHILDARISFLIANLNSPTPKTPPSTFTKPLLLLLLNPSFYFY